MSVTLKNSLLAGIGYCLVMGTLLNIFGICLSYQEQFYEWNIINMPEARSQMFKSAAYHACMLTALLVYYYYRYDYSKHEFRALAETDEEFNEI